ncbi:MAG: hypothetical protein ACI4U3_04270, partial [Traorella sp.]
MGLFNFMKPKSAKDYYDKALLSINNDEKLKYYQKASELGNVEAKYRCGILYDELKQPQKALECYKEASNNGHQLSLIVIDYKEHFSNAFIHALDLSRLPKLEKLPLYPEDFEFVDEISMLSDDQKHQLDLWYTKYQQVEEYVQEVKKQEEAFCEDCKVNNYTNLYECSGLTNYAKDKRILEMVFQWLDFELALLGDSNSQNKVAKHIQDLLQEKGQAASKYWRLRSIKQGCKDGIVKLMNQASKTYDLNSYRYWEKVQDKRDAMDGIVHYPNMSLYVENNIVPEWLKADEKAKAQKRRVIEEYPNELPNKFQFQIENNTIDKSKLNKLFDTAKKAYRSGKVKDAQLAYQQAAFMGDAEAQFRYGRTLLPKYSLEKYSDEYTDWEVFKDGIGNPPAIPLSKVWEGAYWIVKSAKQGNYKACWEMFRLCSEPYLSLKPDFNEMLYWMILTVRAEKECKTTNDEDEMFRPYCDGKLNFRYHIIKEAIIQKKLDENIKKQDLSHIDPIGEALYRIGLFYELDSRYDLSIPLFMKATHLNHHMAKEHLANLGNKRWYDDAANTVKAPKMSCQTPFDEIQTYALRGDLDALMCLSLDNNSLWYKALVEALEKLSETDSLCEYIHDVLQHHLSDDKMNTNHHIFYSAREIMFNPVSKYVIQAFEKTEFRLFTCGLDMNVFLRKVNRAHQNELEKQQKIDYE